MPQIRLQQQNRARRLVALVPQAGARSDIDNGSDSSEDELHNYRPPLHSDSSSSPPSLPSSLENLHLLSDNDDETTDLLKCNDDPKPAQQPRAPLSVTSMPPLPSSSQVTLPVQHHSYSPTTRRTASLPEQGNANPVPPNHTVPSPLSGI